jgi:O-antigen/teichoic acid export membrane protein
MGRFLAATVAVIVGLVVVGAVAIWLLKALLGIAVYLIVGALVIGGGVYLYNKAKRAVGPGTRTRNRLDAAASTYRQRNR